MGIERMMNKRAPALNLKPTFDSCTVWNNCSNLLFLLQVLYFSQRFEWTSFYRNTPFIVDFSRNNGTNCRFLGMTSFNVRYHPLCTDGSYRRTHWKPFQLSIPIQRGFGWPLATYPNWFVDTIKWKQIVEIPRRATWVWTVKVGPDKRSFGLGQWNSPVTERSGAPWHPVVYRRMQGNQKWT